MPGCLDHDTRKISVGFTHVVSASKSQRREKSQCVFVSGGRMEKGLLCSAKNRTVRTLLSMPYGLCHRERRCPDAFVLYILYIFIYIRYTCKLGWCFLLNEIKSIENAWDVCAASRFLEPCVEIPATTSLTLVRALPHSLLQHSQWLSFSHGKPQQWGRREATILCRFFSWVFAS